VRSLGIQGNRIKIVVSGLTAAAIENPMGSASEPIYGLWNLAHIRSGYKSRRLRSVLLFKTILFV
jgi:hypothetical protein